MRKERIVFNFIDDLIVKLLTPFAVMGVIMLVIIIPVYIWRMRLAMNDPERYRRLRDWEEEETARQKKVVGSVASAGLKGLGLGKSMIGRFMKK